MIKKIVTGFLITVSTFSFANEVSRDVKIKAVTDSIKTHQIDNTELDLKTPIKIRHSFDVSNSKQFHTVLRFLDMHLEAGIDPDDIKIAVVVRGSAVYELGKETKNVNLNVLLQSGLVDFYVCGQSLYNKDLDKSFLNPKIKLALSSMTTHHVLQKRGYTLNPF